MDNNFCIGCSSTQEPSCIFENLCDGITLDEVILDSKKTYSKYLVCHKDATRIDNGQILISDECDSCALCRIACYKKKNKYYDEKIDEAIFGDLSKLGILLRNLFTDSFVGLRVKVSGTYRDKRIDAIVKSNKKIVFIKLLSKISKYNFYYKSYEKIKNKYLSIFPEFDIEIIFIVTNEKLNEARLLGYDVISACDINNSIKLG